MSLNSRPRATGHRKQSVPGMFSKEDVAEAVGSNKSLPMAPKRNSLREKQISRNKGPFFRRLGRSKSTQDMVETVQARNAPAEVKRATSVGSSISNSMSGSLTDVETNPLGITLLQEASLPGTVFENNWLLAGDPFTLCAFLVCCSERREFFERAVGAMVMAYRFVLEPRQFLELLQHLYERDAESLPFSGHKPDLVGDAVLLVLNRWFRSASTDFSADRSLFAGLDSFLSDKLPKGEYNELQLLFVRKLMRPNITFTFPSCERGDGNDGVDGDDAVRSHLRALSKTVLRISSGEAMRALAYIDAGLYTQLTPQDLIEGPESAATAAVCNRFNQVSFGVASCILCAKDRATQVRLLKRFCDIAVHAYNNGYFNTAAACVSGFTNHDVSRLKLLNGLKGTEDSYIATARQLEHMVSGVDNYKQLRRKHLESYNRKELQTPFFAMYIKDIAGLRENDSLFHNKDLRTVGLRSFLRLGEALGAIIDPQGWLQPISAPEEHLLEALVAWPNLSREQMHSKSDEWKQAETEFLTLRKVSSKLSLLEDQGRTTASFEVPEKASSFVPLMLQEHTSTEQE